MSNNLSTPTISRLQEWLTFVGIPTDVTGVYDESTRTAVREFQRQKGLAADGLFGRMTFVALRNAVRDQYCFLLKCTSYRKFEMRADVFKQGYDTFRLRTDAAYHYARLYDAAKQAGILVTSSGSDRSLSAPVSAGRVPTSLHYVAIAFDLYIYSAMQNPLTDPYVVERDGDFWRVWARSSNPQTPERTISNPVTNAARKGTGRPVTGKFVDFTALAEANGFSRIKPHSSFLAGGSYAGAEWWHFQCERGLMPNFSTFGGELDTLYTLSQIAISPVARFQERIFGENWG
jgi:hypothetical protein